MRLSVVVRVEEGSDVDKRGRTITLDDAEVGRIFSLCESRQEMIQHVAIRALGAAIEEFSGRPSARKRVRVEQTEDRPEDGQGNFGHSIGDSIKLAAELAEREANGRFKDVVIESKKKANESKFGAFAESINLAAGIQVDGPQRNPFLPPSIR